MQQLKRLLCVWGNAEHGRLGLGNATQGRVFAQICEGVENAKAVVCGGAHTVVLTGSFASPNLFSLLDWGTDSGEVWSFGLNSEGQLGHSPEEESYSVPRRVELPEEVSQISAGHLHTLCLAVSGAVWSFGSNRSCQLGLGGYYKSHSAIPTKIDAFEGIAVSCGALHSLGLTSSGEVYTWGSNQHGQLGYPNKLFSSAHQNEPRLVRELRGVKLESLAAGHVCSGVVDEDGSVFTWGGNQFWQLGYRSTDHVSPHPTKIAGLMHGRQLLLGGSHAMCVMENDSVYVWGTNEHGCLGLGPKTTSPLRSAFPTEIPKGILSEDDAPHGDALIETTIPSPRLLEGTKLIQGSLGWKHSGGVTSSGEMLMWGWGGSVGEATYLLEGYEGAGGQLGHGTDFDAWVPTSISPPSPSPEKEWRFSCVSCGLNHTAAVAEVTETAQSD